MNNYAISNDEMKDIFGSGFDEAYEAEAQARWGSTDAFQESRRRAATYDKATWVQIKAEADAVMDAFGAAHRTGLTPDSEAAQQAVQAHRDHIQKWFNPVPLPMLRGMGEMFTNDPRFAKTYNDHTPGLAPYVTACIRAYCENAAG